MQKQDKALYSQLLTLQEGIRGLKNELKKEREECEEAFRDLEEISGAEFEDDVFLEETEQNSSKPSKPEDEFGTQEICKHDRQDSGISVKTPEAEDAIAPPAPKNNTRDSSASSDGSKPGIISNSKHDLNPCGKTKNAELPQTKTSNLKPVLIQHGKQDSGILIDEDAVKETKLLSKLVESPEMFEKLENRKFDRIIQNQWKKVRDNISSNRKFLHQRSRSNEILKSHPMQKNFQNHFSTSSLQPKHSHTNSCPSTMLSKQFTTQTKQLGSINSSFKPELDKARRPKLLVPSHSRTNSCPQTVLKQFTAHEDRKRLNKQWDKGPVELDKTIKFETEQKEQIRFSNGAVEALKMNFRSTESGSSDRQGNLPTAGDRNALALSLNPASPSSSSKSIFKQNFIPKHHHTRSLPTTPVRELVVAENLLSRQENRQSMQNVYDAGKVVTSKQTRPRKRSASVVDLDGSGEDGDAKTNRGTLTPRIMSVTKAREDGFVQDIVNSGPSQNSPKAQATQVNALRSNVNANTNSPVHFKTSVTPVDSFNVFNIDARNGCKETTAKDNEKEGNLISHKASVVHVKSVQQNTTVTQTKAKVVYANNLKQPQENGDLKAFIPVLVSATEVNVSTVPDKPSLSRTCSREERSTGNYRPSNRPQRAFTISKFNTERLSPRPQPENGKLSPRFLAVNNHLRHNTMPEFDVSRRRHSLYNFHGPSKSWDGYSSRRSSEVRPGIVRSASHVSLV